MLLCILLGYVFLSPISATPVLSGGHHDGEFLVRKEATAAELANPEKHPRLDIFFARTFFTCLFTVLSCLWVSVHPNAPSPRDTYWRKLLRRVEVVLWALVVPELTVCWAVRQWMGARNLEERYRAHGWTMTHAHFLQMGGWVVVRPWPLATDGTTRDDSIASKDSNGRIDNPFSSSLHARQVLSPPLLDNLLLLDSKPLDMKSVTPPLQIIRAHSNPDILITSLAVLQTIWFICQCIAKAAVSHTANSTGVGVLRIELITASYVVMSLVLYVLWWDKPMDVRVSREVTLALDVDDSVKEEWRRRAAISEASQDKTNPDGLARHPPPMSHSASNYNLPVENPALEEEPNSVKATSSIGSHHLLDELAFTPKKAIPRSASLPSLPRWEEVKSKDLAVSFSTTRTSIDIVTIPAVDDNPLAMSFQSDETTLNLRPKQQIDDEVLLKPNHQNLNDVDDTTSAKEKSVRSESISISVYPPSHLASPSTFSFETANTSDDDIEEVPRTRPPSPSSWNESMIEFRQTFPVPPRRQPESPRRRTHENASCHPSPAEMILDYRWRGAGSNVDDDRPPSRSSVVSAASYSADSTIFESIWGSVRSSYIAETTGLNQFFRRCGDILIGKWGKKGYRNAVEEESRNLGKLWMAPPFLCEMVDRPEDKMAKYLTRNRLENIRRCLYRLRGRVPTFYAMASASTRDDRMFKIVAGGLAAIFGAVHLIAWNFPWGLLTSNTESGAQLVFTILWRTSALLVTVTPPLTALALFRLSEEQTGPAELSIQYMIMELMVFPFTLLYVPARVLLMVLTIIELVRIGESWAVVTGLGGAMLGEWGEVGTLRWTRFIPHLQ